MVKTIIRTLVILLLAGLVSGGIYALAQDSSARAFVTGSAGRGFDRGFDGGAEGRQRLGRGNRAAGIVDNAAPQGGENDQNARQFPAGGESGERDFEGGGVFPLRGVTGIARNIAIIAIITAMVVALQTILKKVFRKKSVKPA